MLGLGMCTIAGHVFVLRKIHFVSVRWQDRVVAKEKFGLTAFI